MPPLLRLFWPQMMEDIYGPNPVPALFTPVMQGMTLRPWQLVAVADDVSRSTRPRREHAALSRPRHAGGHRGGGEDRLVSASYHSERLHAQIRQSTLRVIPNAGHMVHHFAQAEVMAAIDEVAHAETQFATAPARRPRSPRRAGGLSCRSPERRPRRDGSQSTWPRKALVRSSLGLAKNSAGGPCSTMRPLSVK